MDAGLLAIKLTVLLLVCCCGPGLLIVGRLRWSPMEKLCGAFAASFIAVYLASFTLFILHMGTGAYCATSCLFALMGLAGWRTARMLLLCRQTRAVLLAFLVVLAWDFLHLAMVRHYGGGSWAVDWREHYDRTRYFLGELPDNFPFGGLYQLPARPPMMNAMAAFFCRQVGLSFEAYSFVFLFLNAWAFVPCCFLLTLLTPRSFRRASMAGLAILFMLNPSIMENVTLTVTKAFTAGLVVLGACFYLRGRIVAAAITLAAGILAHYSAGPYAAAIAIHYVATFIPRRRRISEMFLSGAAAAGLLGTWIIWSLHVFGAHSTFLSNTTATGGTHFYMFRYNFFVSLVPHFLHSIPDTPYRPIQDWGGVNDYYFLMSQTTLPMMAGIAGGIVAAVLLAWFMLFQHGAAKRFWMFFLVFTFCVGIAVIPDPEPFGGAHATLQALAMMGVTLVASRLGEYRPVVLGLILVGAAIDYALGILLSFNLESRVYPTKAGEGGHVFLLPDPTLGRFGIGEYLAKLQSGYIFWGDHFACAAPLLEAVSVMMGLLCLCWLARCGSRGRKAI